MKWTIDEVGAANLFILSRGRHGDTEREDRDVLVSLLREFGMQGVLLGLEKSKALFRDSTDAKGGCKLLSQGEACRCFLCLVDNELATATGLMQSGSPNMSEPK